MYERMEGGQLTDHHDVFEIFVRRSFLLILRNRVKVLWMFLLQIVRTSRGLLDRMSVEHAKTIESKERKKIHMNKKPRF